MEIENQHTTTKQVIVTDLPPLPTVPKTSPLRTHCYLCGKQKDGLEVEHVIPKVLFRGYDPGVYVKLMACSECNRAKGRDDELVARHLQFTSDNKVAIQGIKHTLSGLERGHGNDTRDRIVGNMARVDLKTAGGVIVPDALAIAVDDQRFDSFLLNIAKGLYVNASLTIHDWTRFRPHIRWEQISQSGDLYNDPLIRQLCRESKFGKRWDGVCSFCTDFDDHVSFSCILFYSAMIATVFLERIDA